MVWLDQLYAWLNVLDERQFYQYLIGFFTILVFASGLIGWYYFYTVNRLEQKFSEINTQRQQVKKVLDRAERVRYQRKEVESMLAQDTGFKITRGFQELLDETGLGDKKVGTPTVQSQTEQNYRIDTLTAQLNGITMEQLTQLLSKLAQNLRVYVRQVDMKRSKKIADTLEVTLTIATLQLAGVSQ